MSSLRKIVSTIATKSLSVGDKVSFVNSGEAGDWEGSLSAETVYTVKRLMSSYHRGMEYDFIKVEGIMGSFFSHAFKKV